MITLETNCAKTCDDEIHYFVCKLSFSISQIDSNVFFRKNCSRKTLVDCLTCGLHVNSILLRSASPKCEKGHELGSWVHCMNDLEKHVYLEGNESKCPICGNPENMTMEEGLKVKCLFAGETKISCETRAFIWIKEGPPCFMNHVGKMALENLG